MVIEKMQAEMDSAPVDFQVRNLGGNRYEILQNKNVIKEETGDRIIYHAETVVQSVDISSRSEGIVAFIRMRYTQDDEFALINKGIFNNQNQEYLAYCEYVAWCKEQVDVYFKF